MTRKKGESEWYQLRGLMFPTFPPIFCFFLKDPGPLRSKKRSGYMESCLASHSVGEPRRLSRTTVPDFYPSRILDPGSQIPDLGSRISDPGVKKAPDPGHWPLKKVFCCLKGR
jgi:hypothetical protein